MSTRNSLYMICLAILYFATVINARSTKFSRSWTTDYHKGDGNFMVVENTDMIVYVGNDSMHMTTLDGVVINTCTLSLPPATTLDQRYQAVPLGNGKIVFHFGILYESEDIGISEELIMRHRDFFVIVDPQNCSRTKTLDMIDNHMHRGYSLQSIVPYHDSFDLFFALPDQYVNHHHYHGVLQSKVTRKTPRRFNDLAEPIQLDHHFALELKADSLRVETIRPYDASSGYICRQVHYKSTTLMRLDSKFQIIKETNIEREMEEMSTSPNQISICNPSAEFNLPCVFFDPKDLSMKTSVRMSKPPVNLGSTHVNVVNLPDDSTVVALGYRDLKRWTKDKGSPVEIYLQRIDADGTAGKPVLVDTYYSWSSQNFLVGDFRTKMISLDGGEVCLFVMNNPTSNTQQFSTKCIRSIELAPLMEKYFYLFNDE